MCTLDGMEMWAENYFYSISDARERPRLFQASFERLMSQRDHHRLERLISQRGHHQLEQETLIGILVLTDVKVFYFNNLPKPLFERLMDERREKLRK